MERKREEAMEVAVGTMGVLTAGGVLTFALFPLMLPMIVLLGLLALPLLPLGVVAGLLAAVYLVLRSAVRLVRRARPTTRLGSSRGSTRTRTHSRAQSARNSEELSGSAQA